MRRIRLSLIGISAVVVTLAVVASAVLLVLSARSGTQQSDDDAVRAAARSGLVTMLSADPAEPARYVSSVMDVTTGELRTRLSGARNQLADLVRQQNGAASGQVLTAGIVGWRGGDADVFAVAEATNPQLVGGDPTQNRISVLLTLTRDDGTWKISRQERQ